MFPVAFIAFCTVLLAAIKHWPQRPPADPRDQHWRNRRNPS